MFRKVHKLRQGKRHAEFISRWGHQFSYATHKQRRGKQITEFISRWVTNLTTLRTNEDEARGVLNSYHVRVTYLATLGLITRSCNKVIN